MFRQLPGGEHPVLGGGDKGHVIAVHPGEVPVVDGAVLRACDPLHGGKVILHRRCSFRSQLFPIIPAAAPPGKVLLPLIFPPGGDAPPNVPLGLVLVQHLLDL